MADNGALVKLPPEKCDSCGKFRKGEDLTEDQHLSLGIGGELCEQWYLICRFCEPTWFSEPVESADSVAARS